MDTLNDTVGQSRRCDPMGYYIIAACLCTVVCIVAIINVRLYYLEKLRKTHELELYKMRYDLSLQRIYDRRELKP